MKTLMAILVLAAGAATSAFGTFATPPQGAGVYLAKPSVTTAQASPYTTTFMQSTRIGASLPASGSQPGQCQQNTNFVCAANYDASGNLLQSIQGTYIPE